MRRNEEVEFAVAELERFNIKYDTRPTDGGHVEIVWQVSPTKEVRRVFTSKTASDHRTRLNARSYIRRALRQDGVDIDPKPPTTKKAILEKALRTPEPVETIPDQLRAIRAELSDLTELLLDISSGLAALRDREPVQAPTPPAIEAASVKKSSVRSKKAIDYLTTAWNSIEAIARDLELPVDVTYRKLYYLKNKDEVELRQGQCRLKPGKLQLLRAEA